MINFADVNLTFCENLTILKIYVNLYNRNHIFPVIFKNVLLLLSINLIIFTRIYMPDVALCFIEEITRYALK